MNRTATMNRALGYLWFNACVFSQFDQSDDRYQTYKVSKGRTQEGFLEATNYDILTNIYSLIQAYGPENLNLALFEEGFQEAYEEKANHPSFEPLNDYSACWEQSAILANLPI